MGFALDPAPKMRPGAGVLYKEAGQQGRGVEVASQTDFVAQITTDQEVKEGDISSPRVI